MAISKPSKSARKREYLALQELGENLIILTELQLQSMNLNPQLLEAVLEAKSMQARGAVRRQKQLIGKLMRGENPVPILAALDGFGRNDRLCKAVFHEAEQWRNRMIEEGSAALQDYCAFIGDENHELATMLGALASAHEDKSRSTLRRKIFRQVHHDLKMRVQKGRD